MEASNSSKYTFPKATSFKNELKNLSAFQLLQALKQNMSDAYCITDEEGFIIDINDKYCQALEYQEKELLEKKFTDLLPTEIRPYALMLHHEYIWEQSDENAADWSYLTKSGNLKLFRSQTSRLLISNAKRYKLEILSAVSDKSLAYEKVMKQTQHQFKNTLHEINGLLHLQSVQLEGEARAAILVSQMRITVIALAFDLLYRSTQSEGINLAEYLSGLAAKYQQDYEIQIEHDTLYWQVDRAYALGIILVELLNSSRDDKIRNQKLIVKGKQINMQYKLWVLRDNPFTIELSNFSRQLINALGKQLQAKVDIGNHSKEAFRLECSTL